MARYPEQFIQQVLQTTDIVELVGRYVSLKKRGKDFVGLCPFHEDKNPSMYVSPVKQIYKCFSCGSGGNTIQFVMNFEKLSFPEAVETLADMNSIPLPKGIDVFEPREAGMSKKDLMKITSFATAYFKDLLMSKSGKSVLQYARDRGLTDESIAKFDIGFADEKWDSFINAAKKKGFNNNQLVAAGLCKRNDSGREYDYFRNRLIFPIKDVAGRTVAFGGRALAADEKAKYLNSPQGVLYDKSSMLYFMDMARNGISKSGRAVVVEGYLDAIMPHQEGVDNVVATLGTSLTHRHVRLLSRFAEEAVILFDADVAGESAAKRAIDLFLAQNLHIRVAEIPAGKDPCDFVLAKGGKALKDLIESSTGALDYVWARSYKQISESGGNIARRGEIIDDFLRLIVKSGKQDDVDFVRRQNLAQHIAHLLDISGSELQKRMKKIANQQTSLKQNTETAPVPGNAKAIPIGPEREILEVLLHKPDLFSFVMESVDPSDFQNPILSRIADCVWELGEEDKLSLEDLMGQESMVEFGGVIADMGLTAGNRENHEDSLMQAANQLIELRNRREYVEHRHKGLGSGETDLLAKIRASHEDKNNVLSKFKGARD